MLLVVDFFLNVVQFYEFHFQIYIDDKDESDKMSFICLITEMFEVTQLKQDSESKTYPVFQPGITF